MCKFYAAATLLQSPDPHAVTAPSVTLGTLGPHPAASEGAWAPYAAVVAERRRSALRFSDFWMARAPFSTQAVERRCVQNGTNERAVEESVRDASRVLPRCEYEDVEDLFL